MDKQELDKIYYEGTENILLDYKESDRQLIFD